MESSEKYRGKNRKGGNLEPFEIFFRREGEATSRRVDKYLFGSTIVMQDRDAAGTLIYWFNLIFILKLKDVSLYIRVAKMLDWNPDLSIMQVDGKESTHMP